MNEYRPDRWVVVKIVTATECLYKVFATWSGGYSSSDSWKMNSGITHATLVVLSVKLIDGSVNTKYDLDAKSAFLDIGHVAFIEKSNVCVKY